MQHMQGVLTFLLRPSFCFQYVRFTETNTPGAKERIQSLADRFHHDSADPSDSSDRPALTERGRSPHKVRTPPASPVPILRETRPASSSSFSPGKRSPVKSTPIVTSALRTVENYDEETFGVSGRKKRLAALAAKFNDCVEEEREAAKDASEGGDKHNDSVTKVIDVDEELAAIHDNAKAALSKAAEEKLAADSGRNNRIVLTGRYSPSKASPLTKTPRNLVKEPGFLDSLKAQGFEESTSKSKLTYNFRNHNPSRPSAEEKTARPVSPSKPTSTYRSNSPSRPSADQPTARPVSPYKPHPLQFVSPQVSSRPHSPSKAAAGPASPAKSSSSTVAGRPTSPYKAHPLQFVSPQHQAVAPSSPPVARPPKPVRTYATSLPNEEEEEEEATPRSAAPLPPPKPMTDTASRRSILEKRNMFEGPQQPESDSPGVDPAMMSMSERRALFEKNKSAAAPKPIARFGESVTPAMLQR